MSKVILNDGGDQLYNPIYCNLLTLNDGYFQCTNCSFDNQFGGTIAKYNPNDLYTNGPYDSSGEQKCLSDCSVDQRCTSYTYDINSNTPCQLYTGIPNNINYNTDGKNSGYYIGYNQNKPGLNFNYNTLSDSQKNNIRKKCANQYLNNTFSNNTPNLDLSSCLTVTDKSDVNSTQRSTLFNVNSKCLYKLYESKNLLPKNSILNRQKYISSKIIPLTDPALNDYINNYNIYNTAEEELSIMNKKLLSTDGKNNEYNNITDNIKDPNSYISSIESKKNYMNTISDKVMNSAKSESYLNNHLTEYTDDNKYKKNQIDLNKKLNLENFNNKTNMIDNNIYFNCLRMIIFIIMIIIISILLFYTLRKK